MRIRQSLRSKRRNCTNSFAGESERSRRKERRNENEMFGARFGVRFPPVGVRRCGKRLNQSPPRGRRQWRWHSRTLRSGHRTIHSHRKHDHRTLLSHRHAFERRQGTHGGRRCDRPSQRGAFRTCNRHLFSDGRYVCSAHRARRDFAGHRAGSHHRRRKCGRRHGHGGSFRTCNRYLHASGEHGVSARINFGNAVGLNSLAAAELFQ
jgi:hypothetical protein